MKHFFSTVSLSLTVLLSAHVTASQHVVDKTYVSDERFGELAERYGDKIVSGYEHYADSELEQQVDSVFLLIVKGGELEVLDAKYRSEIASSAAEAKK
ncbi:hypothetical protein J4N45_10260 [Vibrio sp. SCSIO 43140]|uniref:hypothetical protein n=1 Tax=Vibrio sp. SCSIO 43140 TaxID=2819100 RepID=UPI0020754029|nr:hypothetical protein [Vibrio sp. SCSIO 43140]USD58912.1 hypothetical protein J4N45_10260 [Vibrio sp. SCSIO 43140]